MVMVVAAVVRLTATLSGGDPSDGESLWYPPPPPPPSQLIVSCKYISQLSLTGMTVQNPRVVMLPQGSNSFAQGPHKVVTRLKTCTAGTEAGAEGEAGV